tara:strand:- start:187 stop:738 length:552 start_codon:yes stop_codon:yes gene_type:complete
MGTFYTQKISTTNKTQVTYSYNDYSSMTFVNTHATAAVTIDLYVTSQMTTDVTTTGVYAAETEAASTSSTQLTIDNGSGSASAGTSDMFLNERVYKSDGTLFGVCTTFDSTVLLTFSGGLKNAITDNDILFTGTNYHILNNVEIPNGASLKLSSDEFNFDNNNYNLYINSSSATGDIDILIRY